MVRIRVTLVSLALVVATLVAMLFFYTSLVELGVEKNVFSRQAERTEETAAGITVRLQKNIFPFAKMLSESTSHTARKLSPPLRAIETYTLLADLCPDDHFFTKLTYLSGAVSFNKYVIDYIKKSDGKKRA